MLESSLWLVVFHSHNTEAQDHQPIFLIKVATKKKIGILFLLTYFLLQTSLML